MKNERELLSLYADFTNDELCEFIEENIMGYSILVRSEEIAKSYLKRWGIEFYSQHEGLKKCFEELLVYIRLRGINFDYSLVNIEVDEEDIIERILENYALSRRKIEEHFKNEGNFESRYNNLESIYNEIIEIVKIEYKKSIK